MDRSTMVDLLPHHPSLYLPLIHTHAHAHTLPYRGSICDIFIEVFQPADDFYCRLQAALEQTYLLTLCCNVCQIITGKCFNRYGNMCFVGARCWWWWFIAEQSRYNGMQLLLRVQAWHIVVCLNVLSVSSAAENSPKPCAWNPVDVWPYRARFFTRIFWTHLVPSHIDGCWRCE